MPRPCMFEPLGSSLPHLDTPQAFEPKPALKLEVADAELASVKASELNFTALLGELETMNGLLHGFMHGQSRLQIKMDDVQRGLCSVIEAVGCSSMCEPESTCAKRAAKLNLQAQLGKVDSGEQTSWPNNEASSGHMCEQSAHAQLALRATDCNAEDPDCFDIAPGKAGTGCHDHQADMLHRGDDNFMAAGSTHLGDKAALHSTATAQENVSCESDPTSKLVACPLEPKMVGEPKMHVNCRAATVEHELEHILLTNIHLQQHSQRYAQKITAKMGTSFASSTQLRKLMEKLHRREWDTFIESGVGLAILLNAIFIGVSMDASDPRGSSLVAIELLFGVIFWLELIVKLRLHGCREQYCGKDACLNLFDTSLVVADTVQFCLQMFFEEHSKQLSNQGVSASLFRVVRLMRLARVVRILQLRIFKDLLTMIQGMLGGMVTLGWSIVLFVIFLYVVALLTRDNLGPNRSHEHNGQIEKYFQTVPRAMFTMFRCSFGDCSTDAGTPLFEHVTEVHGAFWSLLYSCFVFVMVIGLFNVISAIFIENTLASATEVAAKKRRDKIADPDRWANSVCELLQALLRNRTDVPEMPDLLKLDYGSCTKNLLKDIQQVEFPGEDIKWAVCHDELAQQALHRLDIDPTDHSFLADILDPQNDGSISVMELIDGLKRLRGEPRRSDIISIDLMVRALQERIDDIWKCICDARQERNNSSRWSETLST